MFSLLAARKRLWLGAPSCFRLPDGFGDHVRRHLLLCRTRSIDFPDLSPYVSYMFRRHDGVDAELGQNLTYLWYPWAVEACRAWLEHARRGGVDAGAIANVRRVLGHLVVELGPQAPTAGGAFVFIRAERLYALSSVPAP